jgi:diguanylate cyclase (GGDEF)-like protein
MNPIQAPSLSHGILPRLTSLDTVRWLSGVRRLPLGFGALMTLLLLGAVGLSQLLQERMARHLVEKVLESQKIKIRDRVAGFDGTLRRAETSVSRYANLVSYRSADLASEGGSFEAIAQRDPDGSWRTPRSRFDPLADSNIWVPPSVPLTEANKRFFQRSYAITRVFGLGAQNEVLENAWMLPLIGGMTAFWPTNPNYLYNASSSLDYRGTPWVTLTDPKVNPAHEPRWVGPEYDPAARDWSISVVAPFFRDGHWAGSVGHDMRVSRLLGKLIDPQDATQESFSRPLYVATTDGRVLAQREGAPAKGERVPESLWRKLAPEAGARELAVVPNGSNYLVVAPISTLRALAVYLVDGGWIRQTVAEELGVLQLAEGLFILVAVGSVLGLAIKDGQSRRQRQLLLEERNQDLELISRVDQLTGLPNRLGLQEFSEQAIERARRQGLELMVAFLDVDRFKTINDSLGHAAGDALLVEVARRLREAVSSTDTVARLGGDEFVVVSENCSDDIDAGHLADRLHRSLSSPMQLNGRQLAVSASIGVSVYPADGDQISTLMRQADMAMYEVKSRGRDGWLFFTESMNRAIQERLSLEIDLRQSLERGDFVLHYQPQWTIGGDRLVGWEALLRWNHPVRGFVSPITFIPVAEDTGLIAPLGEWVLIEACRTAAAWSGGSLADCRLSVNLSCRQFAQARLEEKIDQVLERSGLPPTRLELEITETVLMDDPQRAINLLRRLKEKGISIAIDDFGTGYSSLSYLRSFPIDRLKIDRSFVTTSLTDPSGAAIVTAIISLARSLGITTIAEGVETEDQRLFLVQQGCDEVQGYLMGRPMPDGAIAPFLARHAAGHDGVVLT